jgi:hypothetical protein
VIRNDTDKRPVEMFAKAPAQRTTIVHVPGGERTTIYNGRNEWIAAPPADAPVPVVALAGGDLDSARLHAELSVADGDARSSQARSDIRSARLLASKRTDFCRHRFAAPAKSFAGRQRHGARCRIRATNWEFSHRALVFWLQATGWSASPP